MNDSSFDKDNPILRAALMRGLVSRRSAMMGAAGVSAAAFLAACGSAGKNPPSGAGGTGAAKKTAAAATDMSDSEKIINWSNWTEYIDVDDKTKSRPTLEAFTKQTGIKVNYSEDYLDNDEFYAKVRPLLDGGKDTGRDVWCSTDWMVARLIRQGYVQKLDLANIPNAKNLDPSLQEVEFDPGRQYSLPWQSGFAGIGYNLKATGGKKIETMEQGKDISTFTDADFQAAIDVIQQAKDAGQIKGFTGNEYTDGLAKGDIAACVAWTGDVVQLQFADTNIQYTLPQKGFTLWSDNFVIPALAKHKKNAEKLIDYYYDPAVMAQVVAYVNYIAPVAGTKEELVKIDKSLASNPLIVPPADVLARAQVFRGLSPAEETKYSKMYASITAG